MAFSAKWMQIAGSATPLVDDERELVLLARTNRPAFGLLYDRYMPSVFAYCYRRLGTRELAEDATALVFIRALSAIHRYQENGPTFRAWLFTIAHNTSIDELRSRRWTSQFALDQATDLISGSPGPEDSAVISADLAILRGLLDKLPALQARMIELRLAGLSDREIADVLGCSNGSVRVSMHRALKRLRELMNPEGETIG